MHPIKSLIITAIGHKRSGKTTALNLLAEILFDMELRPRAFDFATMPCIELYKMVDKSRFKVGRIMGNQVDLTLLPPNIVLVDGITHPEHLGIVRVYNSIAIRVRYDGKKDKDWTLSEDDKWLENAYADFEIRNENNFRLFKFQLRDLFNSEIINAKNWKESIV